MRRKKLSLQQRSQAVARYVNWRLNAPKRICDDFGIARSTLSEYVREFRRA